MYAGASKNSYHMFVWTSKQKQAKPPKPQGSHLSISLSNTMLDSMKKVLISWNQPWWAYMFILWKAENMKSRYCSPETLLFNIYQNITKQKSDTREFQELEEVVLGKNNIVKRFCSKKKPKKKKGPKLEGNVWWIRQLCLVVAEFSDTFLFCLS